MSNYMVEKFILQKESSNFLQPEDNMFSSVDPTQEEGTSILGKQGIEEGTSILGKQGIEEGTSILGKQGVKQAEVEQESEVDQNEKTKPDLEHDIEKRNKGYNEFFDCSELIFLNEDQNKASEAYRLFKTAINFRRHKPKKDILENPDKEAFFKYIQENYKNVKNGDKVIDLEAFESRLKEGFDKIPKDNFLFTDISTDDMLGFLHVKKMHKEAVNSGKEEDFKENIYDLLIETGQIAKDTINNGKDLIDIDYMKEKFEINKDGRAASIKNGVAALANTTAGISLTALAVVLPPPLSLIAAAAALIPLISMAMKASVTDKDAMKSYGKYGEIFNFYQSNVDDKVRSGTEKFSENTAQKSINKIDHTRAEYSKRDKNESLEAIAKKMRVDADSAEALKFFASFSNNKTREAMWANVLNGAAPIKQNKTNVKKMSGSLNSEGLEAAEYFVEAPAPETPAIAPETPAIAPETPAIVPETPKNSLGDVFKNAGTNDLTTADNKNVSPSVEKSHVDKLNDKNDAISNAISAVPVF